MADQRLPELLAISRGGSERSDPRWRAVEDELGGALPGAYKAMLDRFGQSSWGDFLHVLSPLGSERSLQQVGRGILDADRDARSAFPWH